MVTQKSKFQNHNAPMANLRFFICVTISDMMWEEGIKNQGKSSLWTALYQAPFYEKYKFTYL